MTRLFDLALRDPFAELFGDVFHAARPGTPRAAEFAALNAWIDGDDMHVELELPGVDPGAINVTLDDGVLAVSGERKPVSLPEGACEHRSERFVGNFERRVRMPFPIEKEKVVASYEHGILAITLPRAEAAKPRRIEVLGAAKTIEPTKGA
jgi:HSP20 family protein